MRSALTILFRALVWAFEWGAAGVCVAGLAATIKDGTGDYALAIIIALLVGLVARLASHELNRAANAPRRPRAHPAVGYLRPF